MKKLTEKQVLNLIKKNNILYKYQTRNKQFKDCNRKMIFDPYNITAYSYNHWCFVKVIKGLVVFNDYRYSKTTSEHQSAVKHLMSELGIKIDVKVDCHADLDSNWFDYALEPLYTRLLNLQLFGSRKKYFTTWDKNFNKIKHKYTKEHLKNDIKQVKKQIKLIRSIGAKFTQEQIKELKEQLIRDDTKRLTEAKEKCQRLAKQKKVLKPALNNLQAVNFLTKELNDTNETSFLNVNN